MVMKGDMIRRRNIEPVNLLQLRPTRNLQWETMDEGVVLLIPKFRNRLLVRWLVPMLAKPTIRVKLDPLGSYFWICCDGSTTVAVIGERMAGKFGETVEPLYDRIGKFVRMLARDKFLTLDLEQKAT
ncbi:MAG: hypothetical protein HW407_1579 [Bacteroidetes bacterium]|nr:hypothetical protein [Bacteroidota bacterium]